MARLVLGGTLAPPRADAMGAWRDRRVLPLLQAQVARPLVTEGVVFPGIIMPHDGVPDGTVQAILILPQDDYGSAGIIVSPSIPGLWPRFPQLAGTEPAVNVVRQEPVLMVHKEKDAAQYE